jgi:hypothetical protein
MIWGFRDSYPKGRASANVQRPTSELPPQALALVTTAWEYLCERQHRQHGMLRLSETWTGGMCQIAPTAIVAGEAVPLSFRLGATILDLCAGI